MIKVRRANLNDVDSLLELLIENQSLPSSWESQPSSEPNLSKELSYYFDSEKFINLFECDGEFVGACFHKHDSELTINAHLHIHKKFRGKGLAHKLLSMDAAFCKGLVIVSMVPETNEKLIKAMLKANYIPIGYVPKCWNHSGNIIGRVVLFRG